MGNGTTRQERAAVVRKLEERSKIEYSYSRYRGGAHDDEPELRVLDDLENRGVVERQHISEPRGCGCTYDYTLFTLK